MWLMSCVCEAFGYDGWQVESGQVESSMNLCGWQVRFLGYALIWAWPEIRHEILVKALDCGSKGPGFQSLLQQRFICLQGALSPTPKIE